jgi:hypothetical protein
VNDLPQTSQPALPGFTEDAQASAFALTGSDVEDSETQLTVTVTAGPAHGSFDVTSGAAPLLVVYTPDPDFAGADGFTFELADTDGGASQSRTVAFTVAAVNDAPVAASIAPVTTQEDTPTAPIVLTGTDVEDDNSALTVIVSTGPSHGTLDAAGGTAPLSVVYTPSQGFDGADSFTYRVRDTGNATSATVTVQLTVEPGPDPVQLLTQALPAGEEGVPYSAALSAQGGVPPYTFMVDPTGPALPPGISLASNGQLSGTPTASAIRNVQFRVEDDAFVSDSQTISVTVDQAFSATPSTTDPVQPSATVTISVAGGLAPYTAVLAVNASGGQVSVNGSTVTYLAGASAGSDRVDVFDARARVRTIDVEVEVDTDPFAGFAPRFGETDNWMLNFDVKRDSSHAYRTDLERELVRLGLRTDGAFDEGALHDQLAATLVRLRLMRHTAEFFGLQPSGAPSPGAFDISIFDTTPSTGTAPAPTFSLSGAPDRYNIMEVSSQGSPDGVLGRAFLNPGNARVEHDGGIFDGIALGVDIADCTRIYVQSHPGRLLLQQPVAAADAAVLQELISGAAPSTSRAATLDALVDHYAFRVAVVIAHEIGHSLGLDHNGFTGVSVMAGSVTFRNDINPTFSSGDVSLLEQNLPGAGRLVGSVFSALQARPGVDTYRDRVVETRVDAFGRLHCTGCGSGR